MDVGLGAAIALLGLVFGPGLGILALVSALVLAVGLTSAMTRRRRSVGRLRRRGAPADAPGHRKEAGRQ